MKTHALPLAAAVLVASSALADENGIKAPPPDPALADPRSFVADPPGAETSPRPKPDEWKDAPVVKLTRDVAACQAYRVREWMKIHCSGFPAAGVAQLAGPRTGVALWVDPQKDPSETMKTNRGAEAIFPVQRGDGRLFQIAQFGEGYDGPIAWNLAYTVSEQWVEGERAPIVIIR